MSNLSTSYKPSSGVSDGITVAEAWELVAAQLVDPPFTYRGFGTTPSFGSITPSLLLGATLLTVVTAEIAGPIYVTSVLVSGNRAQGFFTSFEVGAFNLLTSAATYSYNAGTDTTLWSWSGNVFPATGTYQVVFA